MRSNAIQERGPQADRTRFAHFGWAVESDLDLGGLFQPAPATLATGATLRLGCIAETERLQAMGGGMATLPSGGVLTHVRGFGFARVEGGRDVTLDLLPDADMGLARALFAGRLGGALVFQKGLVPLHASAVIIGGRALLVAGPSGAGKSTLVAALLGRGHPLLSDDLCVPVERDGRWHALAGLSAVKLLPATLAHLGIDDAPLAPLSAGGNKRLLPAACARAGSRYAIAGIAVLSPFEVDGPAVLKSLSPLDRLRSLEVAGYQFRAGFARPYRAGAAAQFARLAAAVPMWRLRRPMDMTLLSRSADLLEAAALA